MPIDEAELAEILAGYVPRSEHEATLEALDQALGEQDTLKARADRAGELEAKLRGRSYRDAFGKIADELKVDPRFRDDVFELAKIPQDADEPDPAKMRTTLEAFLKGRDGYTTKEAPAPKRIEAGEGFARGRSVPPGDPEFRVNRQQLGNALWMRENQKQMNEARKAGLLVVED